MDAGLAAGASLASDRALLAAVARGAPGVLRVSELAGAVLALGRYHRLPPPAATEVVVHRRVSGGRVAAAGAGFVGVTLVLPHRSALVSDDPFALAPEQVMNRCVRGVLEGLQLLGANAFYPGRDALTVAGRTIGLAGFAVEEGGATLFEVLLSVGSDLAVLPRLLDAADPGGVVPAGMPGAADTTSVAREGGRTPAVDEVADAVRRGYEKRMGVTFVPARPPVSSPGADPVWLAQRAPRPDLDRTASLAGQLGVLAVHCARDGDRLHEVMLSGDFLADSPGVARLEHELRGCAVDPAAIRAVVERAFAPPAGFFLGVGSLAAVADTIVRAAA